MKALILFSSQDGQTRKIAYFIKKELKEKIDCDIRDIQLTHYVNWSLYNSVIIGASVRYGHFNIIVKKFIKKNLNELQQRPSGFFSVNLIARKLEKSTPKTNIYTRQFLNKSPWKPNCIAVFAGAVRYSRYNFINCLIVKLIMNITKGNTDTKKDIEYTNWQEVKKFAYAFNALIHSTLK